MGYYLKPVSLAASGDLIVPSVDFYSNDDSFRNARAHLLHHIALNDETGAGTATLELYGGLFVPIAAKIINISIAAPAVFTTDIAHGLANGTRVFYSGVNGGVASDRSGVTQNVTATTFELVGINNAGALGTRGRIHLVELVAKMRNYGAQLLGAGDGVGPYVGVYAAIGANSRATMLYHEG